MSSVFVGFLGTNETIVLLRRQKRNAHKEWETGVSVSRAAIESGRHLALCTKHV